MLVTHHLAGALVALVAFAPAAVAQGPELVVGTRVRVTTTTSVTRAGAYRGIDQAALALQVDTATHRIPRETIAKLEQSMGRKPNVATGIVGAILGAGIGGALGCLANKDDYGVYCGGQDDTKVIVGAVIGGLAGGAAGALLFKKEGWREVPVPGR
jgi:hypothetical protein